MGISAMKIFLALLVVALVAGKEVEQLDSDLLNSELGQEAGACGKDCNVEVVTVLKKAKCKTGAKAGDKLTMHYTGTIDPKSATGVKNQKFDSSLDRGTPFTFTLGQGQVIKGWDQGLKGICPGEKRKLVIPPKLGYGANGAGAKIPGGATLDFTVECLKVNDKEE